MRKVSLYQRTAVGVLSAMVAMTALMGCGAQSDNAAAVNASNEGVANVSIEGTSNEALTESTETENAAGDAGTESAIEEAEPEEVLPSLADVPADSPYAKYGDLQLCQIPADNTAGYVLQLCDEKGEPVQLTGMSTYGLHVPQGHWLLNDTAMDALARDWNMDVIRLAMYVTETGYKDQAEQCLERVERGIQLATKHGMYVIVDWHILRPGDPYNKDYQNAGISNTEFDEIRKDHPEYTGPEFFFAYLSQKYGGYGNVMFETANEPNNLQNYEEGLNEEQCQELSLKSWEDTLKPYHEDLVKIIREYDPDDKPNIVICGTDGYSQFPDTPAQDPIDDPAIMYTMHFYAGSHDTDGGTYLHNRMENALDQGLAVFATEWGATVASGDGKIYEAESDKWIDDMKDHGISWCCWSLGYVQEGSSSMFLRCDHEPVDSNGDGIPDWEGLTAKGESKKETGTQLTPAGEYYRRKIREAHGIVE